ncbi:MAG: ACP phosphodiesterase [Sediminicola sp.]|tara:strand:+ start:57348 stop:57932 length:585 start_codon:yes stop_codon:yes gene_type:complete
MNYLAHIYLSFGKEEVTIGNFIADGIKGNKYGHLPKEVQKGIFLHRSIDTFTDAHPIVRQSTKRLHPNYSHYSGVIVDIFYDHFLAKNWERYSVVPLVEFADSFYTLVGEHHPILPERIKRMMPFMVQDNWLVGYASLEGISNVLRGMDRRTKYKSKMGLAIAELQEHYDAFEAEFSDFFDDLVPFAQQKLFTL